MLMHFAILIGKIFILNQQKLGVYLRYVFSKNIAKIYDCYLTTDFSLMSYTLRRTATIYL
jgi:hypothetical protein